MGWTEKLGDISDAEVTVMRDLLFQGGELPQSLPPERYFTHRFVGEMNGFDVPALIAFAKKFRA